MWRIAITKIGLITPLGKTWGVFCQNILTRDPAIKYTNLSMGGKSDWITPLARITDFEVIRNMPDCKIEP